MNKSINKDPIVFILPNLKIGGAQRVFVNYLRTLRNEKFDIYLIIINDIGPFRDLIPTYINVINLGLKRSRFAFLRIIKNLKTINPKLVVSTSNYLNILVLLSSFFLRGNLKFCLYEPSMPNAQIKNKHFPKYYFWLIKLLYRRADFIIAQTEEMKEEIIKYYSSPKNDIIVTSNPLDESLIVKQTKDQKNPYSTDKINIIVSGRISEEKGQDILIRALKEVIISNNNYRLSVLGEIGNQDYYEELTKLVKDLNLDDYIDFLGFKSNPYPYYKYADLLVLPSRWEGLPNVVLEALFLLTPVVVTNCIPHFSKLINTGKNGFIVNVDDYIGMSEAIQNYYQLKVSEGDVPKVDMGTIFEQMITHA